MTHKYQTGSSHVVIIAVLALALLGTLGFVFYQNFVAKPAQSANTAGNTAANTSANKAASPSNTPKQVTLKEFCTEVDKLCFKYPENWQVSSTVDQSAKATIGFAGEDVTIKNPSGNAYLYITAGMSGIGGTCNPNGSPDVTILEAYTTKITGAKLQKPLPDRFADTAYAVKYVQPTDIGASTYRAGMYISAVKAVTQPGTLNVCSVGHTMFVGTVDGDSYSLTEFATGNTKKGVLGTDYPTRQQAIDSLNTEDAKAAYEILKSAYYK